MTRSVEPGAEVYLDVVTMPDATPALRVDIVSGRFVYTATLSLPVSHEAISSVIYKVPDLPAMERGRVRAVIVNAASSWARVAGGPELPEVAETAVGVPARRPLSRPITRLISTAADRLPEHLHHRFATDWATDAAWLDGRLRRVWFALGLWLWAAPRLRRDARRAERDLPRRA